MKRTIHVPTPAKVIYGENERAYYPEPSCKQSLREIDAIHAEQIQELRKLNDELMARLGILEQRASKIEEVIG